MAGNWFDGLARSLAQAQSRRDLFRTLGAALGGIAIAGLRQTRVTAQSDCVEACKRAGRTGRDLGECISGCVRGESVPCGPSICVGGEVCCNESCGICTPPGGFCIQIPCDNP